MSLVLVFKNKNMISYHLAPNYTKYSVVNITNNFAQFFTIKHHSGVCEYDIKQTVTFLTRPMVTNVLWSLPNAVTKPLEALT